MVQYIVVLQVQRLRQSECEQHGTRVDGDQIIKPSADSDAPIKQPLPLTLPVAIAALWSSGQNILKALNHAATNCNELRRLSAIKK